jgi:hypothetical protein
VKIRALVTRDDECRYGEKEWDLTVITCVRDLTESDAEVFWKALRPGGIVVYEMELMKRTRCCGRSCGTRSSASKISRHRRNGILKAKLGFSG